MFFTETQIKSNHLKAAATRKDKLPLGVKASGVGGGVGVMIIYFSNPLFDEYRR